MDEAVQMRSIEDLLQDARDAFEATDYNQASRLSSLIVERAIQQQPRGRESYAIESEALRLQGHTHLALGNNSRAGIHFAQAGQAGQCAECYILAARTAAQASDVRFANRQVVLSWYDEAIGILSERNSEEALKRVLEERNLVAAIEILPATYGDR